MTKAEYQSYVQAVWLFIEGAHIDGFSCADECEPSFSWQPCECCGRPEGGDRHEVTGYVAGKGPTDTYQVCDDCVYYEAHGRLDDDTMRGITQ